MEINNHEILLDLIKKSFLLERELLRLGLRVQELEANLATVDHHAVVGFEESILSIVEEDGVLGEDNELRN